jgi:hypothetical protein
MLPNLVRAATKEPVQHIRDWFHLSMRMRPVEQMLCPNGLGDIILVID